MRKKLAATLSVVLILGLAVLGILAYLTDTDNDVNVMTLGNVSIDQIEQERVTDSEGNVTYGEFTGNDKDENGNFVKEAGKPLYPATIDLTDANKDANGLWPLENNAVDKLVSVKNTGKSDAYVRTWFAFEMGSMNKETWESKVKLNINETDWSWSEAEVKEIDGKNYYIIYAVHNTPVAPNETTEYSLKQVALVPDATNDDVANFADVKLHGDDDEFEILVFSEAIQTEGFENGPTTLAIENQGAVIADYALTVGFGAIHPWADIKYVETADEFKTAVTAGGKVVLKNDIVLTEALNITKAAFVDLNSKELSTVGLDFAADVTIEDGTITSANTTEMIPHLKASGGMLTMNNVDVDVKHHLNANVYWSEATGMEIANANAILNDCNIKIHNGTEAQWVYSYGISLNNANLTVNGGSVTATCIAGTAANGPTNPNAISSMGECTATMNNVVVSATYYGTTVNGKLTINTTDKEITSANIVDNNGGSHTLNYID